MNNWIAISGILGGTSVMLGAFAAHGLEGKVDERALGWIKTASQYQMVHALALLGWALWASSRPATPSVFPGWAFTLGTIIFAGTLYAMTFGAPRWWGAITPIGGTLLIAGWLVFAFQAMRS